MAECESNNHGESEKSTEESLEISSLEGIAWYIKEKLRCRKIIVISGGRISVPAGIPDYRSPDVGLYHARAVGDSYFCEVFNKKYFRKNPTPLYRIIAPILTEEHKPTLSHYFIALLERKNLLLRNYTQNMDNLEEKAGVSRLVQINGSFSSFSCIKCGGKPNMDWIMSLLRARRIPQCRKCAWIIRPDITFYGEQLPNTCYETLKLDFQDCQLLIILGSTLSSEPFASLLRDTGMSCLRLMVNDVEPYEFADFDFYSDVKRKDVLWMGNCDAACRRLADLLGWTKELGDLAHIDLTPEPSLN